MYIRRKIMNECKGNPRLQKAVAIVLYMKQTLSRDGMIKDFSYNKIYELIGIAPTTLRKYLPIMEQHGFVCFQGQNLVLKSLHSKHKDRNICVDKFNFNSFKDTFKSLRSFLALIVQAHKDFLKRTLQVVANPKNNKEFQAARKLVGRLVKQGILSDRHQKYKEFGLGYKRIAKEIGSCVKTAQNIMRYAEDNGWCTKQHNQEQIFAPKVNKRKIDGYTFSTKNNLYIVYANTYSIDSSVACCGISNAGNIRW